MFTRMEGDPLGQPDRRRTDSEAGPDQHGAPLREQFVGVLPELFALEEEGITPLDEEVFGRHSLPTQENQVMALEGDLVRLEARRKGWQRDLDERKRHQQIIDS
jgi:hypothetical protein